MKKLLFLIIVLALALTMLASCDVVSGIVCQHRDADDNNLCDKCEEKYTDGKDLPDYAICQHRDADDSGLCDYCNGVYSDGDDTTYPHQHRDKTDDGKCDKCGTAYSDGTDLTDTVTICQHRDIDDNSLCDKCGKIYIDGKDIPDAPACQHRDEDDNNICDKCKEAYTDGKDMPDAPICQHRDANDNNICDKCGKAYTDGKDISDAPICQHRDADDNSLCDKCNKSYTDGTDLTHSHSFTAWTNYSANGNVSCEERLFYRTCDTCGGIEWKTGTYAEHSFSTSIVEPTCKDEGAETKTCSICGLVETNSIPTTSHTYSTAYTSNNSFHWLECIHCGAKKDETEHTPDTDGFCSVCNRPIGATEGIIYDKSIDGTYAEVIGYEGNRNTDPRQCHKPWLFCVRLLLQPYERSDPRQCYKHWRFCVQ